MPGHEANNQEYTLLSTALVDTLFCSYMLFTSHVIVAVFSHCVPQDSDTALMVASRNGYPEVVRELLSGGAQVDLQDEVRHNIN